MYVELKTKAQTSLSLSVWSLVRAAYFKKIGAKVHISQILWMEDLASKILMGSEI